MGAVTKEMEKHKTYIRRGRTEIHRDQGIVERFNRTLAERLFGHQYAVEMLLPEGKRSTECVKRLPDVVSALNNEVTRLTGKKPAVAIKEKSVVSRPSTPYSRPVGVNEKKLPPLINVRYLYQPGELEGGGTKRATDPIWSLKVYQVVENMTKPNEPVVVRCTQRASRRTRPSDWSTSKCSRVGRGSPACPVNRAIRMGAKPSVLTRHTP